MNSATFNQILTGFMDLIEQHKELVESFPSGKLADWTLGQYDKTIEQAKTLQAKEDRLFRDELYHLLGMGNLTVIQSQKLFSKLKKLGEYRCLVKRLAMLPRLINLANKAIEPREVLATYTSKLFSLTLESSQTTLDLISLTE